MKSMKKFEHGGDIVSFAKSINCKEKEIIDLSSNINFIKPKCTIDFNSLDIAPYPNYNKLYSSIAKHYRVLASQIELFNGGSSAIFTLFRHLDLNKCAIYSPAYLEYKKASLIHNYELQIINRLENIYEKPKKNSLVIFVNPSTPDGMTYDFKRLFKIWEKQNCTVLIDESFLEFTNKTSTINYLKSNDKLYILKSMTKFYSSAGIRLGTIISKRKNIKKLQQNEPMWKLSSFDMHYIMEVLRDKPFVNKSKQKTCQNREYLVKKLKTLPIISKIYKSHANYVLIKLKETQAQALQKHLMQYKIMIRSCQNFDCLNESYIRIAIKEKESLRSFIQAIKAFEV